MQLKPFWVTHFQTKANPIIEDTKPNIVESFV